MNIFENKKISLLKEKIELYRKNAHNEGRFSLFDAKFAIDVFSKNLKYSQLKYMYNLISEWESKCNLSYELGIWLEKLAIDNTVMIHRANLGLDINDEGLKYNENLYNIMNDGLKNYGHLNALGGGAISSKPSSLTLTMTPLEGLSGYINLVSSYKSNDVIIVVVFPKNMVNNDGQLADGVSYSDVYDLSEKYPKIKKEFMIGAILKKNNGFDEFYTRNEIVNVKDNVSLRK